MSRQTQEISLFVSSQTCCRNTAHTVNTHLQVHTQTLQDVSWKVSLLFEAQLVIVTPLKGSLFFLFLCERWINKRVWVRKKLWNQPRRPLYEQWDCCVGAEACYTVFWYVHEKASKGRLNVRTRDRQTACLRLRSMEGWWRPSREEAGLIKHMAWV